MSKTCSMCGKPAVGVTILGPIYDDSPKPVIISAEHEYRCQEHQGQRPVKTLPTDEPITIEEKERP